MQKPSLEQSTDPELVVSVWSTKDGVYLLPTSMLLNWLLVLIIPHGTMASPPKKVGLSKNGILPTLRLHLLACWPVQQRQTEARETLVT